MKRALSNEELSRYARHFALPEFSMKSQQQLKNARVTIIGAGGLGLPVLQYLAAAGCGHIRIIDPDTVERMNLQRQILFSETDIGKAKAVCAAQWVQKFNKHIEVESIVDLLNSANAYTYLKDVDLIVDATDNFPARYLLCDASWFLKIPVIYGAVYRYSGQISVLNLQDKTGRLSPNYRDLFPNPPAPGQVPDCSIGGVLGSLTGVIGTMMSVEALKIITGIGKSLAGKLLMYDAINNSTQSFGFQHRPDNPLSGNSPDIDRLIDYELFCGYAEKIPDVAGISVDELHRLMQSGKQPVMLDVREAFELEFMRFEAVNIPENELGENMDKIPSYDPLIVYCKAGIRSARVVQKLKALLPDRSIFNLQEGIMAYKRRYRPDWPEY